MEVMRMFLLFVLALALPLPAQDPAVVNPKIVKVEFENDRVRVLRVRLGPHERLAMHSHPASAIVRLTERSARVIAPDGSSRDVQGSAGEFTWQEPTTHAVENLRNQPMENIEIEFKIAAAPSIAASAPVHPAAPGPSGEPVALQDEPHHRWRFENQYTRVLEVVLAPGESTLLHTHSHDSIAVRLNQAAVQRQYLGKEWDAPERLEAGGVHFAEGTKKPYTHRVKNVGSTTFHVYDIELLP